MILLSGNITMTNIYRKRSIDLFKTIIDKTELFDTDTLLLAKVLERSCNNVNIDNSLCKNILCYWDNDEFLEYYSNIIYDIAKNLDPDSSVNISLPPESRYYLINKIKESSDLFIKSYLLRQGGLKDEHIDHILQSLLGDLMNLDNIGYFTSDELNPNINKSYKDQIKKRRDEKLEIKSTKMYLCGQCKKRNAKYYRIQTCSGDEGYTLFVTCFECGHKWSIYG